MLVSTRVSHDPTPSSCSGDPSCPAFDPFAFLKGSTGIASDSPARTRWLRKVLAEKAGQSDLAPVCGYLGRANAVCTSSLIANSHWPLHGDSGVQPSVRSSTKALPRKISVGSSELGNWKLWVGDHELVFSGHSGDLS